MAPTYPLSWPSYADGRLMSPTQIELSLKNNSRSGGQSFTGQEQVVASPAARWEAKLSLPAMRPQDLVTFRGFVAAMQGRVGTVLLPAFEAGRQPWPVDAYGRVQSPARARNPRLEGTAYAVDPVIDAAANISVTASAAGINATSLVLDAIQVGAIRAGHRFSIGASLYEITWALGTGSGLYSVSIRPWLRAAIAAGTICEFRAPVCRMRFKTDDEGVLDLEANRIAHPSLNLVEAF